MKGKNEVVAVQGKMRERKDTAEIDQLPRIEFLLRNDPITKARHTEEMRQKHAMITKNTSKGIEPVVTGIIAVVMFKHMCKRITRQMSGQGENKHNFAVVKGLEDDQQKVKMSEDANVIPVGQPLKKSRLS